MLYSRYGPTQTKYRSRIPALVLLATLFLTQPGCRWSQSAAGPCPSAVHQCPSAVHLYPQVPFCRAAAQPLCPQPLVLHGVVVAKVQEPTLGLTKLHIVGFSPSTQVQVPLQSPPILLLHHFGVICNLLVLDSIHSCRSLIRVLNRTGPGTDPQGTAPVPEHPRAAAPRSGPRHPTTAVFWVHRALELPCVLELLCAFL